MGEPWNSILISILSSFLYDLGKSGKNWFVKRFRRKNTDSKEEIARLLQLKLDAFLKEREEILFFDADWFIHFLHYQRPMEKLCNYVVNYSKMPVSSHEEFLFLLLQDTKEAAIHGGRPLSTRDQSVVKELYQMLIYAVMDLLSQQMTPAEQFQIMKISQLFWQALKPTKSEISRLRILEESKKTEFAEKHYEYPNPYIKRFCYSQENCAEQKNGNKEACELTQLCKRYACIVVLGEAGNGKTTELKWVAAYYSERKELPRPALLTLKTYMNETLEELAVKQGCFTENENGLFFIIDGFDEISGENRQNFLKQLAVYHQQKPETRLLISARNHFYREGMLGDFFQVVWIEPLQFEDKSEKPQQLEDEIRKPQQFENGAEYVKEYGLDKEAFMEEIRKRKLEELLRVPFYFIEICKIYKEKGVLPERGHLMQTLINNKLSEDLKKFRMATPMDLQEEQAQIRLLLRKIGAAIHAMDCRTLSEEEYRKLIPSSTDRELLKYSGIWTLQEGNWQFSHNNFGEYLAAEYLLECPLETIKTLVTAGKPELGICGHWYHVLSYLLSISDDTIEEWLLEQDFTLFFNLEAHRIPDSKRSNLLRKEWQRLKKQYEWISAQRYRVADLMKFGASYLEVRMFLEEIQHPKHVIWQQNAIIALSRCPDLFGFEKLARDTLMEICNTMQQDSVCESAILGLLEQKLMGEEELEQLIQRFQDTSSSPIRYALYSSIRMLEKADQYIAFLISGLPYIALGIHANPGRLGNESFELHYAMMTVKTPSAAANLVEALAKDSRLLYTFQIEQVVESAFAILAEAGSEAQTAYWDILKEFYETVSWSGYYSMEKACLDYFRSSGFKTNLFMEELEKVNKRKQSWHILWKLMDDEMSEWVAEQYQNGAINDIQAKWCIDSMRKELHGYAKLAAVYTERTGTLIADKPVIDYEAYRREGEERYRKAIVCQEVYLHLIDELIGLYGKEPLTEADMEQASIEILEKRWELGEVSFDYRRNNSGKAVQRWKQDLRHQGWKEFEGYLMMQWLQRNELEGGEIPEEIMEAARTYYYQYIKLEDFSKAVCWETDTTCRIISARAQKLLYFAWKFAFPMKKEQAEGILTAVRLMPDENSCQELLERHFTKEELRWMVLKNMKEKKLMGDDLHLHLSYCLTFKIKQCAEEIRKVAVDSSRPDWIRKRSVDYFSKVIGPDGVCKAILPKLTGELFLYAKSQIMESGPDGLADCLWEFARQNKCQQMLCYRDLIRLQDIRGLTAYRIVLEKERKIKEHTENSQPLESFSYIRNEDLWEELFKLADLWLEPDFEDAEFAGLALALRHAFSGIAGSGEKGYQAVKARIKHNIQSHQNEPSKQAWLYRCLGDAQRSYRQSVQRKWPLDKVKDYIFS